MSDKSKVKTVRQTAADKYHEKYGIDASNLNRSIYVDGYTDALDDNLKSTTKDISTTNSPLGSYHWFATLMGRNLRIGEFLKDKSPDEDTLRSWGKNLYDNCKELILGHDKINSDQSHITKLEARNKELETLVKDLTPMAKDGYKLCVSNGSHQDFLEDDREILRRAEQELNKK